MTTPHIESAAHLPDEEAKRIALFASEVGEALHLVRYGYRVMTTPAEHGAMAHIDTITDRYLAEISVCESWMEWSDDERMNCIVHEVIHLVHRDVDHAVRQFDKYTHDHEFRAVWELYRRETELMVDHWAMYMADFTTLKTAWADSLKQARKDLKK